MQLLIRLHSTLLPLFCLLGPAPAWAVFAGPPAPIAGPERTTVPLPEMTVVPLAETTMAPLPEMTAAPAAEITMAPLPVMTVAPLFPLSPYCVADEPAAPLLSLDASTVVDIAVDIASASLFGQYQSLGKVGQSAVEGIVSAFSPERVTAVSDAQRLRELGQLAIADPKENLGEYKTFLAKMVREYPPDLRGKLALIEFIHTFLLVDFDPFLSFIHDQRFLNITDADSIRRAGDTPVYANYFFRMIDFNMPGLMPHTYVSSPIEFGDKELFEYFFPLEKLEHEDIFNVVPPCDSYAGDAKEAARVAKIKAHREYYFNKSVPLRKLVPVKLALDIWAAIPDARSNSLTAAQRANLRILTMLNTKTFRLLLLDMLKQMDPYDSVLFDARTQSALPWGFERYVTRAKFTQLIGDALTAELKKRTKLPTISSVEPEITLTDDIRKSLVDMVVSRLSHVNHYNFTLPGALDSDLKLLAEAENWSGVAEKLGKLMPAVSQNDVIAEALKSNVIAISDAVVRANQAPPDAALMIAMNETIQTLVSVAYGGDVILATWYVRNGRNPRDPLKDRLYNILEMHTYRFIWVGLRETEDLDEKTDYKNWKVHGWEGGWRVHPWLGGFNRDETTTVPVGSALIDTGVLEATKSLLERISDPNDAPVSAVLKKYAELHGAHLLDRADLTAAQRADLRSWITKSKAAPLRYYRGQAPTTPQPGR